jgi:hypothetical protein
MYATYYQCKPTPRWHWLFVPVAAVTAALVAALGVLGLQFFAVMWMGAGNVDPWIANQAVPLLIGLLGGYAFASAGRRFAPSSGQLVAFGLTVILTAVLGLQVLAAWHHPEQALAEPMRLTLGAVAAFVGTVIALVSGHGD